MTTPCDGIPPCPTCPDNDECAHWRANRKSKEAWKLAVQAIENEAWNARRTSMANTLTPETPPCPKCGGELQFTDLTDHSMTIHCTDCEYAHTAYPAELVPLFTAAAQHYLLEQIKKSKDFPEKS